MSPDSTQGEKHLSVRSEASKVFRRRRDFPSQEKSKREKKVAKSPRKLIQESECTQDPGCKGVSARPPGAALYKLSVWGRGLWRPTPSSHWCIHKELSAPRCDWLVVEKAELKSRLPHVGVRAGRRANRSSPECQKSERARERKNHTRRHKKTEVSLLISRQPRYAGRARGFQRASLAWTFGEGCLESPPCPRRVPQPFPGTALERAVHGARGPRLQPDASQDGNFLCVGGGLAHLWRPWTLGN